MAENLQDGFFREIDDELRQEHYAKLWKRYGSYIIAAALILVASVAGYQGWRAYDIKTRGDLGESFNNAQLLAGGGKVAEAEAAFSRIEATASGGYAILARFQKAALQTMRGQGAGDYGTLSVDASVSPVYQDLAKIIGAIHETEGGDARKLMERLEPLSADGNPWRHSAREVTATLAMRAGDTDKARQLLTQLSDDATAPRGTRKRAAELLAAIGK